MWLEYLRSMSFRLEWDFCVSNTVMYLGVLPLILYRFLLIASRDVCLMRLLGFDMVWRDIQRNGVWEVMVAQTFFSSEFATGLIGLDVILALFEMIMSTPICIFILYWLLILLISNEETLLSIMYCFFWCGSYFILQLLEPGKHTWLLKTLYGLLMLLPQVNLLNHISYKVCLCNSGSAKIFDRE